MREIRYSPNNARMDRQVQAATLIGNVNADALAPLIHREIPSDPLADLSGEDIGTRNPDEDGPRSTLLRPA
jgi:hypothetical protein